jgi:glycosyltransferase involved in cell wall biosynthesis
VELNDRRGGSLAALRGHGYDHRMSGTRRAPDRSILVFSSYPRPGRLHDGLTVGGAAYTKALLTALRAMEPDLEIEVIGEVHGQGPAGVEEEGGEGGIVVRRIWKRGQVPSILRALLHVFRSPIGTLVVSYEVTMVGGKAVNAIFLLGVALLRLKKRVVFLLHQVPRSFEGLVESPVRASLMDLGKRFLFRLVRLASSERIVFEEPLAGAFPGRRPPVFVPFVVEALAPPDRRAARERMNLDPATFHLLYFGFLSPYKGLDRLLDLLEPAMDGVRLIVAGDANPMHRRDGAYARYVDAVKARARERGALLAGFVDEAEIGRYFAAADVVVFPYRIFFSSSYVLSLAFSNERPVLLARPLAPLFEGRDYREAADRAGLSKDELTFDFTAGDFQRKVRAIARDPGPYVRFSRAMKEARRPEVVMPRLLEALVGGEHPAQER